MLSQIHSSQAQTRQAIFFINKTHVMVHFTDSKIIIQPRILILHDFLQAVPEWPAVWDAAAETAHCGAEPGGNAGGSAAVPQQKNMRGNERDNALEIPWKSEGIQRKAHFWKKKYMHII